MNTPATLFTTAHVHTWAIHRKHTLVHTAMWGALVLVGIGSTAPWQNTGHTQPSCPDPFGANEAHQTCRTLRKVGRCHDAELACRDAVARCPLHYPPPSWTSIPCTKPTAPSHTRQRFETCQTTAQCAQGLQCRHQQCQPPASRALQREFNRLHKHARALWTHSPCDARAMLEHACQRAVVAHEPALLVQIQAELRALRALCPDGQETVCSFGEVQ